MNYIMNNTIDCQNLSSLCFIPVLSLNVLLFMIVCLGHVWTDGPFSSGCHKRECSKAAAESWRSKHLIWKCVLWICGREKNSRLSIIFCPCWKACGYCWGIRVWQEYSDSSSLPILWAIQWINSDWRKKHQWPRSWKFEKKYCNSASRFSALPQHGKTWSNVFPWKYFFVTFLWFKLRKVKFPKLQECHGPTLYFMLHILLQILGVIFFFQQFQDRLENKLCFFPFN